ncbi:MAG: NAD-glutamate dehydrogenase, partial [Zetaproteobacteria bacterium]
GGIRHSDRPADFRTEILELMDTQTIKNGQIVPTGAKGGFVTTRTGDPETVRRQYRVFIRSLLSITDNRQGRRIVPPAGIRIDARDRNDPYLVVAADKGTARFSDDANAIARECGFWLDDAFASGGSHGYDHKALGITARGAWVCAAEHFRRLGVDAWRDAISAVGIGDMSGDVFGNGMLLNPRLRLVAAFNHRHIFLDPQPDPARAFAERQRLFRAGLGWDAYRAECISTGGGVFDRSAKSIRLSAAARRVLGIDEQTLSGEALIRAILTAPVDLLYNGGIGTYVKDAAERHEEVRDPANNAVRVDAQQLRCKVVCEGGNLGFTQAARIAFAKAGGLINTDAIDNSAGVDMSDHEVNLKLLLGATPGVRMSIRERNRRLKALSDTVTRQCLNNNLLQSRALTVAEFDVALRAPRFHRLVELLQRDGWLIEPVRDFPRPTLAVLLGQEKNRIHAALNKENFAARSLFADALLRDYFPPVLQRRFAPHLADHPLAREITHTQAANAVVNHLGIAAVAQLQTLIDASMADIIEALLLAEHVLDARALVAEVWQTQAATDDAARLQQQVQEGVLQFAEELLRISDMHQWDAERMCALRTALRRFAAHHPKHASSASQLQRFAASAEMASALGAAEATGAPLSRAFNAARACFALIPFQPLERAFRSPLWGEAEAHALRRLCLHRLTRLKARAIATLLHAGKDRFQRHGERIWGSHPCWHHVRQSLDIAEQPDEESSRMRCLLLLNQIEALLGDNAAQLKQ